jgi:heat shock protein HtpX
LIANRLRYLSEQSIALGQAPYVRFDERQPESYWDDFLWDVLVKVLPAIFFFVVLVLGLLNFNHLLYLKISEFDGGLLNQRLLMLLGLFLCALGLTYLVQILYSYPNDEFGPFNIRALLKKIKVSAVRPVACTVKGRVIGRGVPGLIYSEDFVMQDGTGIIFLDYQQPLGIFTFLFGLMRAGTYIGQDVEIIGWYRRAPIPYIEIKKIKTAYDERLCYVYHAKVVFAWAMLGLGAFLLGANLFN